MKVDLTIVVTAVIDDDAFDDDMELPTVEALISRVYAQVEDQPGMGVFHISHRTERKEPS
jgi:hypothetical protein